jgi:hypothetical protein
MAPLVIAAALASAGELFKGITAFIGGNDEKRLMQQAADQARQESSVRANISLADAERAAARAATMAAGGGGVTGSAIDVLDDLGRQAMFNARSAIYAGESEAQQRLYEGRVAKAEGVKTLITSGVRATSSFLGATGQASAMQGAQTAAASGGFG